MLILFQLSAKGGIHKVHANSFSLGAALLDGFCLIDCSI